MAKLCRACGWEQAETEFYVADKKTGRRMSRCRTCDKIAHKKWREENREVSDQSRRRCHLKYLYGITLEDFDRMLAEQRGECAICGKLNGRGRESLYVDHSHKTGAVRGLLCRECNTAIGMLKESPQFLCRAVVYLTSEKPWMGGTWHLSSDSVDSQEVARTTLPSDSAGLHQHLPQN